MRASAFFPPGLHPVLDRGPRDKHPVVPPKVPTGRLIRQSVFDHQADGQGDHAMRVMGTRQGQIGHIGVEVFIALRAMVDRMGEVNDMRSARNQVSQIVQRPCGTAIPIGTVSAKWARLPSIISSAFDDFWLGQVLHARDALRSIRQIFAWSWHGMTLRSRFQAEILAKLPWRVITNSRYPC
jgi:hypothetical protein